MRVLSSKWFERILLALIVVALVAITVPGFIAARRSSNERSASAKTKQFGSVQVTFKTSDYDEDHENNYWTSDVAGLYHLAPSDGVSIRLIERDLALADGNTKPTRAGANWKADPPHVSAPSSGYWFQTQKYYEDESSRIFEYGIKHTDRFSVIAYPEGASAKIVFILSEGGTMYKRDATAGVAWKMPETGVGDTNGELKPEFNCFPNKPLEESPQVASAEIPAINIRSDALSSTIVTAHLQETHSAGKNLIWCSTFQLAWNELSTLVGEPIRLQNEPPMVESLRIGLSSKREIDEPSYFARAGFGKDGINQLIKDEMKAKFEKEIELPPVESDEILAYAYLRKALRFPVPLDRCSSPLNFSGTHVQAFGLNGSATDRSKQISVLHYGGSTDFVAELQTWDPKDRLILARLTPGRRMEDTVRGVLKHLENPHRQAFHKDDVLSVPCINFDLRHDYTDLNGKHLANRGFEKFWIKSAFQTIAFRLDEQGARLESSAGIWSKMNGDERLPKFLICDGPFLILMMRGDALMPYFAAWFENPELFGFVKK